MLDSIQGKVFQSSRQLASNRTMTQNSERTTTTAATTTGIRHSPPPSFYYYCTTKINHGNQTHVCRRKAQSDSRVRITFTVTIVSKKQLDCAVPSTIASLITHATLATLFREFSIYHKSQQVYTEKEIIALAAKAGVNANSIPEIHQSLIDDGLVEKEKIGGSNYCWSFKAKKDRMAQKTHQQTLQQIQDLKPKVEEAAAELADAKRGREETTTDEDNESRASKLKRLGELSKKRIAMEAELESLKENDPAALADLEKELKLVTEAANRWTDNIFECKTYLVKKRGMEKKEAMRILGITSTFDCK